MSASIPVQNSEGYEPIDMPPFSESASVGWFLIMESKFYLREISNDETKFCYALISLPVELVSNITTTTLTNKNYEELKSEVIFSSLKANHDLYANLTNKPSIYLQELIDIANKVKIGEKYVKMHFIQVLPDKFSKIILALGDLTTEQLGNLADELVNLLKKYDDNSSIETESIHDNKIVPTSLRPYHHNQVQRVCRGHIFYGDMSRTCKPWCQWPNKERCEILTKSR